MRLNSEGFLRGISPTCQYCSVSQVHFVHTDTHADTQTLPVPVPKPDLSLLNTSLLVLFQSSIKLAPFSPFSHPVFYQHHPFRSLVSISFKKKKNSAHTFFLCSSPFSFSFYLDLSFCRSATGVYQHWLVSVLLWLSHIKVISLQLRKIQWLLGDCI